MLAGMLMTGCCIKLKVSKSKHRICYYFMDSSLIFQFLYKHVLNYRYSQTDSSTLFNLKTLEK